MQTASFPFVARVNSSIRFVQQAPFKEGAEVEVLNALPNGQFVNVLGHKLPVPIERLDLSAAQLDLVRSRRNES